MPLAMVNWTQFHAAVVVSAVVILHMFSLPPANGYPVGSTTFVTPKSPPVIAGSAKIKRNGQLLLTEVCFTAYYPCDVSSTKAKKGLPWLSR
jgi:hypothetical protein